MTKKALITGITGQDGSYLAEFLLYKGYEVHGIIRKSSNFTTTRIDHLYQDPHEKGTTLFLHYDDLTSLETINSLISRIEPDEIYNLGAQSHVHTSFQLPEYTTTINSVANTKILEVLRQTGSKAKFYQASSSEMFGKTSPPQSENSIMAPRSPYAISKLYSYWMTINYREAYNIFATNGILFNHESPRRGETFVTRKITKAIAKIKAGIEEKLYLGNLESKRDWGFAPEYVEAMWQMLQLDHPDDFVLGTGNSYTVKECVAFAFDYVNLDWEKHVEIDPKYFRPTEVTSLEANSEKAKKDLHWNPKVSFENIIKIMIDSDMQELGLTPVGEGKDFIDKNCNVWYPYNNKF